MGTGIDYPLLIEQRAEKLGPIFPGYLPRLRIDCYGLSLLKDIDLAASGNRRSLIYGVIIGRCLYIHGMGPERFDNRSRGGPVIITVISNVRGM
ncbi:hypothetical protein D3C73_895980 [compost metagenome]